MFLFLFQRNNLPLQSENVTITHYCYQISNNNNKKHILK